jgi:hypothetical protein
VKSVCQSSFGRVVGCEKRSAAVITTKAGWGADQSAELLLFDLA